MNSIFWLLRLLTFYSLILAIRSVDPEQQPFIFKSEDIRQYYLDWGSLTNDFGPYAAACPPVGKEKVKFNQNNSLDHKSLFVENYNYVKTDTFCYQFFELSAVIHSEPEKESFIEFGYEVYFDKLKYPELISKESVLKNFKRVSGSQPQPAFHRRTLNGMKKLVGISPKIILKEVDPKNPKKMIERELGFIWFSKIVIRYDFKLWNVNSFSYIATQNPKDLDVECTTNGLGEAFYGNTFLQKYYDEQNKIFSKANLPIGEDYACTQLHQCVKKFNLLPYYQFRSHNSLISCSDLTSVPIWYKNTEALLNYTEQFLVAMTVAEEKKIEVIPGTYEILKLSINGSDQEVYLNTENNTTPVPRIIYKIVKYDSFTVNKNMNFIKCAYIVVIVIHNEPDNELTSRICTDKCRILGWENIQHMTVDYNDESVKSDHIYCCGMDADLKSKLNYVSNVPISYDLNLHRFPSYSKDGNYIDRKDRKKIYEKKMRDLFPEEPSILD